ncbi:hypothetical protein F4814DRAFT_407494 [Daldinia grandis]|nr:hypothetical protein F4814DRAFT_407494 [Daldinia grandis]
MLLSSIFGNNTLEFPDSILFCPSIFLYLFRIHHFHILCLNTHLMISGLKFIFFAHLYMRLAFRFIYSILLFLGSF